MAARPCAPGPPLLVIFGFGQAPDFALLLPDVALRGSSPRGGGAARAV